VDLVLKPRLGLDQGFVLGDVGEVAVDRVPGGIRAERLVAGEADHAGGGDPVAGDRGGIVAVFGAERAAGFVGAGEGVKAAVGPVVQHRGEGGADVGGGEVLHVVQFGFAPGVVVAPGEQVDGAVVVDGADHPVEVDDPVEELPGHIPLQGFEERVGAEHVAAGGPVHVHEIVIPAEGELPQREPVVAGLVGLPCLHLGVVDGAHRTPPPPKSAG